MPCGSSRPGTERAEVRRSTVIALALLLAAILGAGIVQFLLLAR